MNRFVILGFSAAACAAVAYWYNHRQQEVIPEKVQEEEVVKEVEEPEVEVVEVIEVVKEVEEPEVEVVEVFEVVKEVEEPEVEVVEEPVVEVIEVVEESAEIEVTEVVVEPAVEVPCADEDECAGACALPETVVDQQAEAKRIRQERERELYQKWQACKEAETAKPSVPAANDEPVPILLDITTRMILVKLRTVDRFALKIERCVSTTSAKSVYFATGENDFQFAMTVYHQQGKMAKKEYQRLLQLENSGLPPGVPSPVLHRGNVLLTRWIDDYSGSSQTVQTAEPDHLAQLSKKERKKAVKEAQAENRKNIHTKEIHNSHISGRKVISQRLYNNVNVEAGDNIDVM